MEHRTERNYGIDLLRLISMLWVVIIHILGYGGISDAVTGSRLHAVNLLMTLVYPAVNCYAIISGYVGYSETERPYRYSKYLSYWVQTAFYCVGVTLGGYLLGAGRIQFKDVFQAAMPVAFEQYWYFTAYSALFFMIPWLNRFIRALNRAQMTRLVLVCFVIFSLYASLVCRYDDQFFLHDGLSFLWITLLYFYGAWMRKCSIPENIRTGTALLVCFGCLFVQWILTEFFKQVFFVNANYFNPMYVIAAVCLVSVFSKLRLNAAWNKVIRCFAPAAFGVYLLHQQRFLRLYFITDRFTWIVKASPVMLVIETIACSLGVFIICLLIEKLRILLFRILRVNKLTDAAAHFFGRCARSVANRVNRRFGVM